MGKSLRAGLIAFAVCGTLSLAWSCGYTDMVFIEPTGSGGGGGEDWITLPEAGTTITDCDGECVAHAQLSLNWAGPELVWFGPPEQAPNICPFDVYFLNATYHGDLVAPGAPQTCDGCFCQPSGSCELSTKLTADTMACNIAGGSSTDFSALPGWNGTCDSSNPINAPNTVQSLTVEPMKLTDSCALGMPATPTLPGAHWATTAIVCSVANDKPSICRVSPTDDTGICLKLPDFNEQPDWRVCVYSTNGSSDCSTATTAGQHYTEQHTVYKNYADNRSCTPCGGCSAPVGGSCSALVTAYKDDCCGCKDKNAEVGSLGVDSTKSNCGGVMPTGVPLLSKQATQITYTGGTCEATGGKIIGTADPIGVMNFCCLPPPPPRPQPK